MKMASAPETPREHQRSSVTELSVHIAELEAVGASTNGESGGGAILRLDTHHLRDHVSGAPAGLRTARVEQVEQLRSRPDTPQPTGADTRGQSLRRYQLSM